MTYVASPIPSAPGMSCRRMPLFLRESAAIVPMIVIAARVYGDAEDRGQKGVLWMVAVLLPGIIGLVIWLIARNRI